MRPQYGLESLRDVQRLQRRGRLRVGEGHGAELNETQRNCGEEGQRKQPAFIFEVSIIHEDNCNRGNGFLVNGVCGE